MKKKKLAISFKKYFKFIIYLHLNIVQKNLALKYFLYI